MSSEEKDVSDVRGGSLEEGKGRSDAFSGWCLGYTPRDCTSSSASQAVELGERWLQSLLQKHVPGAVVADRLFGRCMSIL